MSAYYPTFFVPENSERLNDQWLRDQCGDGPFDLIDVTDICAGFGVRAALLDEEGHFLGWVDVDGSSHDLD